jgi:PAS domain S-box-containing protein
LLSSDGETFQIAGSAGMPDSLVERWQRYPRVGQFPLSKVAETGQPVWIESSDAWRATFPETIADFEASGFGSMASLPLMFEGRLLGGLSFDFRNVRAFSVDDQEFMQAVAHQTTLALERARLFELERAARENAASAEARYRGLFEGSGDAVFVLDARGRIVDLNDAAASITGCNRVDCLGNVFEALWTADTASLAPTWSAIDEHGSWDGEHLLKRADGDAIPVETRAVAVDTPNERVIIASSRELTRRKMVEQAQQALFASVSHDLKSPLAVISLQAQLIRRSAIRQADGTGTEVDPRVDVILAATQRMNAIIDELVEVAQLRLGHPLRLNYSQVDLVELAQRSIEQQRESAAGHDLALQLDDGPIIGFWDAARLDRVFDNLLGNAIKYSPGGGRITVRLSRERDEADDEWAVIEVTDEGIGIPAGDLSHIFEHFRRGANVQDRIVGSGIGLAGVRQVVEQHRGTASVQSKEGSGTTIQLRLPTGTRDLLRATS